MNYKKRRAREIKDSLNFWKNVRTHSFENGNVYYEEPESQRELDMMEELRELENRDEYGIERW